MGAWDAASFGNDRACDWAGDLEDYGDIDFVEATLQAVLDVGGGKLDPDIACNAIAAAEVVAMLHGHPPVEDPYTESVIAWAAAQPFEASDALLKKAIDAIDRIQREPSELMELWEDDPEWTAAMADLRKRLTMG